jgi:membrane protease YdiL (CAAX protease family)
LVGPKSPPEYVWLVVLSCANGFAEELVLRGYLLPRFEGLLKSTWRAAVVTSLTFASYHLHYGVDTLTVLMGGLLYAAAFCWLRRLWPLAVAHALQDFYASYLATGAMSQ